MPYLREKYYWKKEEIPVDVLRFRSGYARIEGHPLFGKLDGYICEKASHLNTRGSMACVTKNGEIYVNTHARLQEDEWAYVLAHCLLHLAFGHFDQSHIPQNADYHPAVWNKACDIYIARFLADIGFGKSVFPDPAEEYPIRLNDEIRIYEYLLSEEGETPGQSYGCSGEAAEDMIGVRHPIVYKANEENPYIEQFTHAITSSARSAVNQAGSDSRHMPRDTMITRAAEWFLSHYPLLGGLAASFRIIEDTDICYRSEIRIAAVDAERGEIYANPACSLSQEEWKFVLAHEYLHAGLQHHKRCMGRDHYLWNVACDYVINDWLCEMQIGTMPSEGLLYDESLHGMSAEEIYDIIVKEMRKFRKLATFRGYGKGDMFDQSGPHFGGMEKGMSLDEFFKNALREGLDYHMTKGRGYLPAGLVEEIRALSMPPIPWEVELARWFDLQFPPLEKHRTYARPSRRQGSTPEIPRPSYALREEDRESRTFGVVIDTSGSMSTRQIGLALGAAASYAMAKDVPFVRLVFCDAAAADAGYLAPEEIAGRVEVTGRGGTVLQPGVDLLLNARDFPVTGPILIITDGEIEPDLKVKREHAFLIPKGSRLPFRARGKVFYFKEQGEGPLGAGEEGESYLPGKRGV